MGKKKEQPTATFDVLSRMRKDGEKLGLGDTVDLTQKQHAQAFASGAVSEEPIAVEVEDPPKAPPAAKKTAAKKAASKKAASKKADVNVGGNITPTAGEVISGEPPSKPER